MPSENKTPNYGLNQWQGNEYPKRQDFVDDNATIDAQMKENEDAAAAKIPKSLATASDQILVSSGVGAWIVKTLAQFKSWLGLGSAAYKNESDFETPSGAQEKADAALSAANGYTDGAVDDLAGAGNATTVKAVDDALKSHLSDNSLHAISTILADNIDLNTVTRSGFYRLSATNPNMPAGCAYGQLLVVHGAMDTILQIVSGYNGESPYYRNGNPPNLGGGGSWSAWKRLLNQDDYDQLFQYANDGKTGIANAVTAKGVAASPTDTFATLAGKIGQIQTRPPIIAGDNWAIAESSPVVQVSGGSESNPTKMKEFVVNFAGSVRLTYNCHYYYTDTKDDGEHGYTQERLNGVALRDWGVCLASKGYPPNWGTKTIDIAVNQGDVISIWGYSTNMYCEVCNAKLVISNAGYDLATVNL